MSDPLSDVLSLVEARSVLSTGFSAGGAWSVRVSSYDGLKFNAVVRGTAWLAVDGHDAIPLGEGDCFMLAHGAPFVLSSDPTLPSVDAATVFAQAEAGVARMGTGETFLALGGKMTIDAGTQLLLLDTLPAMIHLAADTEPAQTVRWLLQRFIREATSQAPGSDAQATHSMHMMFVELMRHHLAAERAGPAGWLGALADERIARTIRAMHEAPSRDWTLQELAATANLSRSGYALRFKKTAGITPLDYLLRWRMHLAARALRQQRLPISAIAEAAGYASESAFGSAFKRVFGSAPRTYVPRA